MDIFNILGYINKLSLLAFVVTLGILLYQFYLLRKDSSHSKEAPVIPDFNESAAVAPTVNYTKLADIAVKENPSSNSRLVILIIVTVGLVAFLSFAILAKNRQAESVVDEEPLIKLVASKGIKIYDDQWIELKEKEVATLSAGTAIIIALDVPEIDNIDKARIRINQSKWSSEDESVKFDQSRRLYYRDYIIASGSSFIKAEAQLHSTVDGWLGE